ncbi:MAG: SRPBCC family protein [Candidatus Acidiferrales bacterium]
MHRFQYSVTTKASPSLAWDIYSNCDMWRKFADIYGTLNWEGRPWEVGSRLEIECVRPVKTVIDHLIICCEPPRELGWIDRALGVTISQWVEFELQPGGGTRVRTWGEISPPGKMIVGRTVEQLVQSFTETWYENFRIACDGAPSEMDLAPTLV